MKQSTTLWKATVTLEQSQGRAVGTYELWELPGVRRADSFKTQRPGGVLVDGVSHTQDNYYSLLCSLSQEKEITECVQVRMCVCGHVWKKGGGERKKREWVEAWRQGGLEGPVDVSHIPRSQCKCYSIFVRWLNKWMNEWINKSRKENDRSKLWEHLRPSHLCSVSIGLQRVGYN